MVARTNRVAQRFAGSAVVRDVVIGMSDGLTVPFALAAGLSGAVDSSFTVLVAGIAEIAAGSIAIGLGGYLSTQAEADFYRAELAREQREIREMPDAETEEVRRILRAYGLSDDALSTATIRSNPDGWARFMIREELGLEEPDPGRSLLSVLTVGLSYVAGGFLPLLPYALDLPLTVAFQLSIIVTLIAFLVFGAVRGHFTGVAPLRGAIQAAAVGGVAAAAAFALARLVSGFH